MRYRTLGRAGWEVSEIGYGMWGMGAWTDSNDEESLKCLELAVELGCSFFDTAWAYGKGRSEKLLGRLIRAHPEERLYTATKIPPKNFIWPSQQHFTLDEVFPPDHIFEYTEKSLENMSLDSIDLMQFHVWEDDWAHDERWQRAISRLKDQGMIKAVGISVNRWEPNNVVKTLQTGLIDTVQVIYNIFDQAPEDRLFPVCDELNIGVIARVPFDEGTLTGKLTKENTWPEGDWRNTYFVRENLIPSVEHADKLKPLVPKGITMAEIALRFILFNKTVSTVIPGMRKLNHLKANISCSDGKTLPAELVQKLRGHRWDRKPTSWS